MRAGATWPSFAASAAGVRALYPRPPESGPQGRAFLRHPRRPRRPPPHPPRRGVLRSCEAGASRLPGACPATLPSVPGLVRTPFCFRPRAYATRPVGLALRSPRPRTLLSFSPLLVPKVGDQSAVEAAEGKRRKNSFRKVASKALAKPASGKARANSSDAAAQEGGESDTGGRTMSVSKGVGIPVKLLHEAEGHIVTVSRGGDLVLRAGGRALLGPRPPSDLPTNRCGQAEQRSHSDERRLSPFLLAARTQVELKTGETFRGTLKVSDAACGSAPFRSDRRAAEVRPRPLSSSPGLTGASHPPLHSLVRAFRTPRTIGTASLRMSRPRRG